MHSEWVRDLRDRCLGRGTARPLGEGRTRLSVDPVPFLFKQWGAWAPMWDGPIDDTGDPYAVMRNVGKKAAGRVLDGRTWDEYPG